MDILIQRQSLVKQNVRVGSGEDLKELKNKNFLLSSVCRIRTIIDIFVLSWERGTVRAAARYVCTVLRSVSFIHYSPEYPRQE